MSNQKRGVRIGVLVPAGNTVHEREFADLATAQVEFAFRGFGYPPPSSPAFCADLAERMAAPIAALRDWGAVLLLVGCTTASMKCAGPTDHALIQSLAGVPVVTAAQASLEAIAALGLRAISVATPYGAVGNAIVKAFLESQRVTVTAIEGLDLDRSPEVWSARAATLPPREIVELGLAVDSSRSRGLYLPCTGIGSLEAIVEFERRAGKPAFSSVQAGYWASLRRLGVDGRRTGGGQLLERWDF